MKIVCESCGAKYSIADERVAGKVFKIRCKRCSEVIVVRGDQPDVGAEAPAAAQVEDQNAIWHVVVDGEQAGPFSVAQLSELLSSARIDWESYVWTEGFDNWLPLRDVPDLVSALSGEPAASEAAPVYRHSATSTLTGQPSMGADPFADSDQGGGGMFGNAPPSGSHDLFGSSPEAASPFGGGGAGVVASAPSPRVGSEGAMTGARNENSVLFSLKNLQALATGTPSVSPAPALGSDRGGGFAAGEGSGLIDIRALAAATGMGDGSGGGGARDELLTIGSQGGAFGALGSPILAPVASDDDGNRKTMIWALVAAVGIASVAAVAIVFVLKGSQSAAPAPVAVVQQPVAAPAAVAPAPGAPAAPTEGELAARAAAAASATGTDKSEGSSSSGSSRRRREGSDRGSSSGSSDSPSPSSAASEPAPKGPAKPSGPRTLDDLLDDAVTGGRKPSGSGPAPAASNLPDTPSRDQVVSAMNSVKPAVSACAKPGESAVATVAVSVAGETGRVTNAQVNGVTGPMGSCVAQAVRKAQFPKFSNKVFKVNYPFKL